MAVKKPVAILVCCKFYCVCLHRHDVKDVLQGCVISLAINHAEVMAMQVHRVTHHGIISQDQAYLLSSFYENSVGFIDGLVVQGPHISVHVPGEIKMKCLNRSFGQGSING